jgi:hypothetical protein
MIERIHRNNQGRTAAGLFPALYGIEIQEPDLAAGRLGRLIPDPDRRWWSVPEVSLLLLLAPGLRVIPEGGKGGIGFFEKLLPAIAVDCFLQDGLQRLPFLRASSRSTLTASSSMRMLVLGNGLL